MRTICFIVSLTLCFVLQAQPPKRFYATYGGEGDDIGYSAKVTLDNQYIVAGSTSSFGNNNTDVYLFKVNQMGNAVWHKHHGGIGNDVAKAVIQLPDSGFVIAGYTDSFGAGGFDVYIMKTDKLGNFIWQQTWGGSDWEFGNDLVLASDGTIMVVGFTQSFGAGKKDGFVLKYDQAGKFISEKFIGGVENDELRSIIKTSDNNLATVGYTESKGEINGDMYFLKLDNNSDTLFTKTVGGAFKDFATDVIQKLYNDTYIICGAKTYSVNGKSRSYFAMLDATGKFFLDSSRYNSVNNEHYISVANSNLKNYLTGYLRNLPVPNFGNQGNIMVQDNIGYEYAINSFGGGQEEYFYSIEATPDSGFVTVGSTTSFNANGLDTYFIKIDGKVVITYESIVSADKLIFDESFGPAIYEADDRYLKIVFDDTTPFLYTVQVRDTFGRILDSQKSDKRECVLKLPDNLSGVLIVTVLRHNGSVWQKKLVPR